MGKLHGSQPRSKPGSLSSSASPGSEAYFGPTVDFTRGGYSEDRRRQSGRRSPVGGIGGPKRVQNTTRLGGSLRRHGGGSSRGPRIAGGISAVARSNQRDGSRRVHGGDRAFKRSDSAPQRARRSRFGGHQKVRREHSAYRPFQCKLRGPGGAGRGRALRLGYKRGSLGGGVGDPCRLVIALDAARGAEPEASEHSARAGAHRRAHSGNAHAGFFLRPAHGQSDQSQPGRGLCRDRGWVGGNAGIRRDSWESLSNGL